MTEEKINTSKWEKKCIDARSTVPSHDFYKKIKKNTFDSIAYVKHS